LKGLYIVSETACLNPKTGAGQHIQTGIVELQRDFEMELMLFCDAFSTDIKPSGSASAKKKRSPFFLFAKWCYTLCKNHVRFYTYFIRVKRSRPQFIFERASYLNYNGWLIAKLLRIKHFYEVNGILAHDNAEYFVELCNRMSLCLEKCVYRSTNGFYVGGINTELGIHNSKSHIIQNGIDAAFAREFTSPVEKPSGVFSVAFIGHAMSHHRLDVLARAFHKIENLSGYRLHLVGSNMNHIKQLFPTQLEIIDHGSLGHDQIVTLLKEVHAGVIPYSKSYFSHVKLFMYGAARLAVILPHSRNYDHLFSSEEVLFVKNADANDIASKMAHLNKRRDIVVQLGENLHRKVLRQFTWESIYADVRLSIKRELGLTPNNVRPVYEDSTYT
jgi:glycosyltransferase involved in cell wall biosynthesis